VRLKRFILFSAILFFGSIPSLLAETVTVNMYRVIPNGQGSTVGDVQLTDTYYGLLLTPRLYDLPTGVHGFHIHQNASCANYGMAAGGHLDPKNTGKHLGPYDANGHLGDLPALTVDTKGQATLPVLAPRLTVSAVRNHTLMIHVGGDNYSDSPEKLGGGGVRLACGVIP